MFKTQKTIDAFFMGKNSSSKKYELKRYFYLIWTNKYKPECQAYWTDKKPEKINFINQVQCDYIKKGYYFYICGYFPDTDDNEHYFGKEKIYKNIAYLKSHLQKCIRKGDEQLALSTSLHMFRLDISQFLRRLPIIMLEDVTLHESFSTIIWLMIAIAQKNGFKLKKYIYEWLLGIIYSLCKNNDKDTILEEITDEKMHSKNVIEILDNYSSLDFAEYSVLYSIHMRIAYGGMDCDARMMQYYAYLWNKRFREKSKNIDKSEIRPICVYVRELDIKEWDVSAIDFHCNSKLIKIISKKYNHLDEDDIKKIIWYHSSSINKREKMKEYNVKEWDKIKGFVMKTQKYLLDSSY